ncbi:MAG: LacI family DNA-binding transcriptional regulator [Verrucomicrobiae bacterium]|nr:LacI family DNA-binding transcriptional regulator [Verrucomicrobiae bacterium]
MTNSQTMICFTGNAHNRRIVKNFTLKDIAERCNVSRMSVSAVLRDPQNTRYSKSTRVRILAVARRLNYVPNRMAVAFKTRRQQLLSLIVPWNIPELMDYTERIATDHGYALLAQFTPEPDEKVEQRALSLAIEHRVDGILWMPSANRPFYPKVTVQIHRLGIPLVLLGTRPPSLSKIPAVMPDYADAFDKTFVYLNRQGYSHVVLFHEYTPIYTDEKERERLFCQKSSQHHLTVEIVETRAFPARRDYFNNLIRKEHRRVAFCCDSDWSGLECQRETLHNQWNIPREVGMVIMGDLLIGNRFRIGELTSPTLTAIGQPFADMSRIAVRMMMEWLGNGKIQGQKTNFVKMPFVVRASTDVRRQTTGRPAPQCQRGPNEPDANASFRVGGRRPDAFTILELIVVIAIISILTMLISPALKSARDKAKGIQCMNNLRQCGLALIQYAQDFEGYLPCPWNGQKVWGELLYSKGYVKDSNIYFCPSANGSKTFNSTYGMNYGWPENYLTTLHFRIDSPGASTAAYGFSWAASRSPAQFPLLADSGVRSDGVSQPTDQVYWFGYPGGVIPTSTKRIVHCRHSGYANVLMFDGHVGAFDKDSLSSELGFGYQTTVYCYPW